MKKKPRCYNSGPISSLSPIAAWYNFERADRLIADELQMQPVNPMKVTGASGVPHHGWYT